MVVRPCSALPAAVSILVVAFALGPRVRAGSERHAVVVVYDGTGAPGWFRVGGRVLEDPRAPVPTKDADPATNLIENVRALESDEVRGVDVVVHVGAARYAATTDADGNFEVVAKNVTGPQRLSPGVVPVEVELRAKGWQARRGRGSLHVIDDAPAVAVLSDIDDTVVKTNVPDKLRMAGTVLLKNARQLEPVVGAAENYAAAAKAGVVAFFYVSGSPQNLYPRLRTFLDDNDFPPGPLWLKNIGDDALLAHDDYKIARIERVFADHPQLRFILVGDSGERDPEIYREIRRRHADRVVAVVIRKVPSSKELTPERFAGMVVVDDVYPSAHVIAALVPPPPRGTPPPLGGEAREEASTSSPSSSGR